MLFCEKGTNDPHVFASQTRGTALFLIHILQQVASMLDAALAMRRKCMSWLVAARWVGSQLLLSIIIQLFTYSTRKQHWQRQPMMSRHLHQKFTTIAVKNNNNA
jgi:hypothetical protein